MTLAGIIPFRPLRDTVKITSGELPGTNISICAFLSGLNDTVLCAGVVNALIPVPSIQTGHRPEPNKESGDLNRKPTTQRQGCLTSPRGPISLLVPQILDPDGSEALSVNANTALGESHCESRHLLE